MQKLATFMQTMAERGARGSKWTFNERANHELTLRRADSKEDGRLLLPGVGRPGLSHNFLLVPAIGALGSSYGLQSH